MLRVLIWDSIHPAEGIYHDGAVACCPVSLDGSPIVALTPAPVVGHVMDESDAMSKTDNIKNPCQTCPVLLSKSTGVF